MMSSDLRIIYGQGRCGTSLIMQMLAAGGAVVTGEWPAFEDDRYQRQLAGQGDWGWLRDLPPGACLKALDADLLEPSLPPEVAERGIFLRRNFYEQARSKAKFLRASGRHTNYPGAVARDTAPESPRDLSGFAGGLPCAPGGPAVRGSDPLAAGERTADCGGPGPSGARHGCRGGRCEAALAALLPRVA